MKWFCRFGLLLALCASCSSLSRDNTPYQDRVAAQQRQRAAEFMNARDYAAAAATLDSLVVLKPADSDLFEMLGDARRAQRQFDPAVKAYEQAIRLNYGAYSPHMKLGTLLMENGKTGRALTEFELAVKASDRDVLARYNYGVALWETDRHDEALAQWSIASELDPLDVRVAEALAMGHAADADTTAVGYFEHARKLGAKSAPFLNNYGLLLDRLGRSDEAAEYFMTAIEKAPGRDEYVRNYAVNLLRRGHTSDAAGMFADLVARDGGKWSDTVYLARAKLALERYDDAIAALEPLALDVESGKIPKTSARIDRMPPTLAEALDILGMCRRGLGDKKAAADYLRRAVALEPDDVSHLNNYGVVLAEFGMLPEARKQWRRVLEIEPQNATAKANLSAFGR
ncbi:MAG TPA: tetratricopeptide repeat protein [Candidatus Krumholzibacteria bacterium]